ncbi:hypothetical protein LA080_008959 [Diaporthe eres]|uniref:BZIP transcription factor n=1 Tax=Diaporthe vaccinii TaxID=105482 RepID=A0ABR4DQN3_9PEZI|nr:hypothetical protein LA080_008959 [Diaporthe eres]
MAYATTSHVRSSAPVPAPINTNMTMKEDAARQTSAEPPKTTKRKGTRSVSTLTPSQLARKRANDREAQRAIRARTKEHIERLERELEDLKGKHNRDDTVQDLIKRNKALETELKRLRESMGIPHTDPYPNSVYEQGLPSMPSSGIPSRSSSYGHSIRASPDGYGYSHIPTPEPNEPWAASIPVTVPSTVSSPSSSGPIEDYGYMPTSVPAPLMDGVPVAPTSAPYHNDVEYEDGVDSDHGFHRPASNHVPLPQSYPMHHHQHQQWNNMYGVYYPQSPSL